MTAAPRPCCCRARTSGTVPFLLMLIVLLVRPAGLMGSKN